MNLAAEATATAGAAAVPMVIAASAGLDWKVAAVSVLGVLLTAIVNGVFSVQRERARGGK